MNSTAKKIDLGSLKNESLAGGVRKQGSRREMERKRVTFSDEQDTAAPGEAPAWGNTAVYVSAAVAVVALALAATAYAMYRNSVADAEEERRLAREREEATRAVLTAAAAPAPRVAIEQPIEPPREEAQRPLASLDDVGDPEAGSSIDDAWSPSGSGGGSEDVTVPQTSRGSGRRSTRGTSVPFGEEISTSERLEALRAAGEMEPEDGHMLRLMQTRPRMGPLKRGATFQTV